MGQALLIHGPPEVVLLAIDSDEDFVDEERVTIASVLSFQSFGVQRAEFDTPKADRFATDDDATFG